jgi:hypothetical protein
MTQLQLRLNLITEMAEPKRFFGVFAKLRKANLSFLMSVRPPACPHGTTSFPLHRFS